MAHITLPDGLPGIRGPMAFRPETAKPLNELVDVLLRGPHTLSPGRARADRHVRVGAKRVPLLPDDPRRHCRAPPRRQRGARPSGEGRSRNTPRFPTSSKRCSSSPARRRKAAGTSLPRTSPARASTAPPTSKFTTPCSSPRRSACSTATSTAWRRGRRTIPSSTVSARHSSPNTDTPPPRFKERKMIDADDRHPAG